MSRDLVLVSRPIKTTFFEVLVLVSTLLFLVLVLVLAALVLVSVCLVLVLVSEGGLEQSLF